MDKAATRGGGSDRAQGGGASADSSPGPPTGTGLTRITVNLNRKAMEALDALSESNGLSKTDTINRALQVYALIQDIMDRSGGSLVIRYSDGQIERVHIV
jgi:hypothetical protein